MNSSGGFYPPPPFTNPEPSAPPQAWDGGGGGGGVSTFPQPSAWAPPPPLQQPAPQTIIYTTTAVPRAGTVRGCCACCCACLPRGFLGAPFALISCVLAIILSIVSACGTGDVFWVGWSQGSGSSESLYRLTLNYMTTCDTLSGDAFCTEFFAKKVAIRGLPLGSALVGAGSSAQSIFSATIAVSVLAFARFVVTACCCSARSDGEPYAEDGGRALPSRRWQRTAALIALLHVGAAAAIAYALELYRSSASAFIAAQPATKNSIGLVGPVVGATFIGGFSCGIAAVVFHGIAASLWLGSYFQGRAKARRAAAQQMGAYAAVPQYAVPLAYA